MTDCLRIQELRRDFDKACRDRDSLGETIPDHVKNAMHRENVGIAIPKEIADQYNEEIILYKETQADVNKFYGLMQNALNSKQEKRAVV